MYKKDIDNIIKSSFSKSDSLLKVNTFIDNWAKKQLLLKQAKIILSENDLIKLEKWLKITEMIFIQILIEKQS